MIGIGIIGCGVIGQKRAKALGAGGKLVACADVNLDRAVALSNGNALSFSDWRQLLELDEVEAVIIATQHDSLAELALAALKANKHVFIEKPGARNFEELEPLASLVEGKNLKVRIGFNHRYHKALLKAKELVDLDAIGELMFIRGRYGHGGRIGYDREWRSDPSLSGGGELIDQGPHLIDLARWFFGSDFTKIEGVASTFYWDMPVDDNGFLLLRTAKKQVAFLHASCTEWKNLFSFEIYGKKGKLEVSGLGGSYGTERLSWYRMLPEMGPPETTIWEYPMADDSWAVELREFYEDIRLNRTPNPGLRDAVVALQIVQKIYGVSGYDYSA